MITMNTVFSDKIVDSNNNNVADINAGLIKYYPVVVDKLTHYPDQYSTVLTTEDHVGQPDLIAYQVFHTQEEWYWFLVSNFIEDPFKELPSGYKMYIYNTNVQTMVEGAVNTEDHQSRIGSIVKLN